MSMINFNRSAPVAAPSADTFSDGKPRAKGFINLWIPRQDGSRYKLAGIPVTGANPTEAEILEVLKTPEGLSQILNVIEFDYNEVKGPNASGIVFAPAAV